LAIGAILSRPQKFVADCGCCATARNLRACKPEVQRVLRRQKLCLDKNLGRLTVKTVKSLLLGSAASLVAVSAAQAADLSVKAKPIEHLKICSLYGAGFYYMPGTDL